MSDDAIGALDRLHQLVAELYGQGRYHQAIPHASQAVDIARRELGEKHRAFATTLSSLGELYRSVGDYAAAEPLLQRALDLRRRLPNVSPPEVVESLNNLGALYFTTNNYSAAEPLYHEALDVARAAYGTDHPDYARSLNNLALLCVETGDYATAESLLREALQISQQSLGKTDPLVAQSLSNLGNLYARTGDLTQAQQLYQQALATYRGAVGDNHPEVGTALNNLALVYERAGDLTQAELLFRQAIAVYCRTLGEDHPSVATARRNLTRVNEAQVATTAAGLTPADVPEEITTLYSQAEQLREQGRYAEAIPLLERHRQLVPRVTGGEEHPIYAKALTDLAETLWRAGDRAAAEPLLRQALDVYRRTLGEAHPYVAMTAHNLGRLYFESGDFTQAEPLLRQSVDSMRQTLGKAHPDTGTAMHDLGTLYLRQGNVTEAEPLLREALEVYRRTVGEMHPYFLSTLEILAQLGLPEFVVGRRPDLEQRISRLQEEDERLHGEGRYAESVPVVEQMLALTRQLMGDDEHSEVAAVLERLALLYSNLGDSDRAEALMTQALEITQRTLGEAAPEFAMRLNNLGYIRRALGDYATALPLFERALKIAHALRGDEDVDVAVAKNNLAGLYMAMGKYAAAEPLYRQALATRQRLLGASHPAVAELLDNLGQVYFAIGDYAAALQNAQQALDIYRKALGKHHPDVAVTLGNLAMLQTVLGDYAAAQALLRDALRINRAAFGEHHRTMAATLSLLARLYWAMGRHSDAERQYKKAMAIEGKVLPADHPLLAMNLHNLAALRLEMGNAAAAGPLLQRALEVQQASDRANSPDRAKSLYLLAWSRAATLDTGEALELLNQAAEIDDRTIGQVFSIGSELQRMLYASDIWARCAFHLPLLLEQADRRAAGNKALDLVLRRKGLVAESVAMQRSAVLGGHYPELAQQLRELDSLRMRIGARTLRGGYGNEQLLEAWIARRERLEAELARQIPEMTLEQQMHAADRRSVADALPDGAALVEFIRFVPFDFRAVKGRDERQWRPARYVAFVLAVDAPDDVQMLDLGTADHIDRLVAAFRASITGAGAQAGRSAGATLGESAPTDVRSAILAATRDLGGEPEEPERQALGSVGEELRAALVDPLQTALVGRTRLVLAPDGDLNRLPFEVLPLDDARRLIDVYQISYAATGRDVLRFGRATGGPPGAPVVAADPAFDLSASLDQAARAPFRRLAGSRAEGEQVAAMLGVQPVLADAVLETQIKKERAPCILHLATHGFFLPDQTQDPSLEPAGFGLSVAVGTGFGRLAGREIANPLLRSGLALAGANTWLNGGGLPPEAEDGLLMAEDVTGLDLLNTELVVLSACDTGLGDIRAGEGVFGLRRAFMQAGAQTLVMSLWKVRDRETQELMVDFYERTLRGEPRAEALRSAQLTMKARNPHPLYWGAFICQGDPGPLSKEIRERRRSRS